MTKNLEKMTIKELKQYCKDCDISGYSYCDKKTILVKYIKTIQNPENRLIKYKFRVYRERNKLNSPVEIVIWYESKKPHKEFENVMLERLISDKAYNSIKIVHEVELKGKYKYFNLKTKKDIKRY